jgi:hypothetical protein
MLQHRVVVCGQKRKHVTMGPHLLILMQKFQWRVFGPCHVQSQQPVAQLIGSCHVQSQQPVAQLIGSCHVQSQRPVALLIGSCHVQSQQPVAHTTGNELYFLTRE